MSKRIAYKRLGDYIERCEGRNSKGLFSFSDMRGVNNEGKICNSIAKTDGLDLSAYKIARRGDFIYNPARLDLGSISRLEENACIVSTLYVVFRVRPDKEEVLLPGFLEMWIHRPEFHRYVSYVNWGSAREYFWYDDMCEVTLPIPDIDTQKRIVNEYQAVKSRLFINESLISKLKDTAQTIYKKYFIEDVDFENLPSGWHQGTLDNLGEIISGATPSTEVPDYWDENGISWLSPADLSREDTLFISRGAKSISALGYKSASTKLLPKGTVLFSSRAPIGLMAIADGELCTNQGFKSIVPHNSIGTEYCYYALYNLRDRIANENTGATFAEVSGSAMKLYEILVPSEDACKVFSERIKPLHNHIRNIEKENRLLLTAKSLLLSRMTQ